MLNIQKQVIKKIQSKATEYSPSTLGDGGAIFPIVGSIIAQDNDLEIEVNTRLLMGINCYYHLRRMFSSKVQSKYLKVKLYMKLVRLVVLYVFETWTLRKSAEMKFTVCIFEYLWILYLK